MSIVSIPIEIFMSKRPLKEPVLMKIMFRNCIKYRENVTQKTSVRDRKVTQQSEIAKTRSKNCFNLIIISFCAKTF